MREANDEAGHAHLRAQLKELRDHAKVSVREHASSLAPRLCRVLFQCRFLHTRQVRELNQHGDDDENSGDHQVRALHRAGLAAAVGFQLRGIHRRDLRGRKFGRSENESPAENGREDRAPGIE